MSVNIRGKQIGDGAPCYITFEAGPTHNGVESAIELVKLAHSSGADAIKFQIFDPDKLVADKKQLFSYDILLDRKSGETKTVSEPLYDILKRRSLSQTQWRNVKKIADELDIAFFATVGFQEDLEFLTQIGCDSIKIASADVNHFPLLEQAAKTGMCIQLDTGNASLGEIEQAVDVLVSNGNDKIIIHQCPSGYPAHLSSINLNMIKTLKTMFPYPAAFSDHSPGWDMDIAALAVGADLLEKTITFDRCTPSVEHLMSIERDECAKFIESIRDVEIALGGNRRIIGQEQLSNIIKVRRSAFINKDLKEGVEISLEDLDFRRPGNGIPPSDYKRLIGKRLNQSVSHGDQLGWHQIES
mgnify:FL=1